MVSLRGQKMPRGRCFYCDRDVPASVKGNAYVHGAFNRSCPGSGQPVNPPAVPSDVCQEIGCEEKDPGYGPLAFALDGWFRMRDGRVWCEKHHPAWVRNWRSGRA